ncbi:MAG: glycosyltransferase [Psychroserpens sp.]|uniref:glycosyltransferase n=1 Tax=Psychroserpens sp. TaxID=2020870 RepID=UPI003C9D7AEB
MAKRVKILFTTSNFKTAGSGKVIYDLVNGLDQSKFEIEIACGHNRGAFFQTVEALGLPIHIVKTKTSYRPYLTLYSRIKNISTFFKAHEYDIIHSWQWSNDWTEAVAARLAGAKWMYTKKAMGFQSKHWVIKSYLANFIVTINDEMRRYFPKKKNQRLIPLGIDTAYYSPKHFDKRKISEVFEIITVANLVAVKGISVLIQAIKALDSPHVNLTILGANNTEYGTMMVALVKELQLEHQISFLGQKPDVRPYLSNSDLYVIPTLDQGRREGMPMALVEAMSMGVPVLGSEVSGIKYVLKDFPQLLFKAGSANDLQMRIRAVMSKSKEERHQIGNDLRQYCITNFNMPTFIKAHDLLYSQMMNLRPKNA